MRNRHWDRARYGRPLQDRLPAYGWIPEECRDENEETEVAFHRVWLARQLHRMPAPRGLARRLPRLPRRARENVVQAVEQLWESVDSKPDDPRT